MLDKPEANLNIAPVNSGVIFDFMNNGIIPGTNICHFVAIDGTNNPATTIATNDNNINIINEKSPFLIKSNNNDVNTSPIFENLNIATNSAAQNVINNNSPILLTGLVNTLTKSFSVFIVRHLRA